MTFPQFRMQLEIAGYLHLAAETGTANLCTKSISTTGTNVMGTSNLLQAISLAGKESKVKKIILSSSRSIFMVREISSHPKCGVIYPMGEAKKNC